MKTKWFALAGALALAGSATLPTLASAQSASSGTDGSWLVRVRALNLASANKDSTGLGLTINDKVLPEVDVSYFLTPNISAELVLTYPQSQTIRSNGTEIGSLKHLPPSLMAQYHLTSLGAFMPYAGVGVNYTRFSNVTFVPAVADALGPSIKKNSFGPALQVGFDYAVTKNLYLNVDVKKVWIGTDVRSFGTTVGRFRVDPWLIGGGVGYRF